MLHRQHTCSGVLLFLLLFTIAAVGQISSSEYERAANLRNKYRGLTVNQPESPRWIKATGQFIYRKTVTGGHAYVLVDPKTATKNPAFDHEKVAAALSKASGETYTAATLPFERFRLSDVGTSIEFPLKEVRWSCDFLKSECSKGGPLRPGEFGRREYDEDDEERGRFRSEAVSSPDGKWEAFIQNYNLFLRAKGSSESFPLSLEGTEGNYYERRSIRWSPDSKHIAVYRIRQGYRRKVHYIESSPKDQLQPKLSSIDYAKPGDILDLEQPVLFEVESKKQIEIDNALFPNPFALSSIEWRKDGRAFTFEYNQRGHQLYRIVEVDAKTGTARAVITETSKTFIDYPRLIPNPTDTGKTYRYDVNDGSEVIWMSERDGWGHLYLFDGITGKLKNQITKGNWVVRAVDRVDEEKRQIWFQASGMYPGKDPYFTHAYRINFDGTGLTTLTDADANHQISYSQDGKYFVDLWSRVDLAPVMQLRRADDGSAVMELERADISKIVAAGWKAPEVFWALGRDGKTDIWGIISRPANFDPKKKYPVIEAIYAGPQGSFVPKSFTALVEPLTELGFVVVHIDGMGTNNRSKAFHDVAWHNLKDAGFEDRILWHKAVAAKYPWYDISRVGIYGGSAGGQNAMAALLFHPEFYHAAVANCGSHDNRIDKIWWNELWMGWPIGPHYAASSNVDNAHRLQGKLMLIVGEMDSNVDPAATLQVVNALIKANKKFELLFVPGGGHGAGGAYGQRALQDFFVHNLLGIDPPEWNRDQKSVVAKGQ